MMGEMTDGVKTKRRSLLKTAGVAGLGAAGLGVGARTLTSRATAASISISSNPVTVENDRGDVTKVTISPDFDVNWQNFDDAVGKVFWLVEAKVADGDWYPLYRATPWLGPKQIGTTGTLELGDFASRLGRPIVVAGPDGVPEYDSADWDSYLGNAVSQETYMNGVSMGSASDAAGLDLTLQNNFPSDNAGYYGAAAPTKPYPASPFDEQTDGTTSETEVSLRYTIELQRINMSQAGYIFSNPPYRHEQPGGEATPAAYAEKLSKVASEEQEGEVTILASDIDEGNSRIVMEGEDGYPSFGEGYDNGAGIPYNVLRDNASDHPGIILDETTFTVTTVNEQSTSNSQTTGGGTSHSGTGAS
jgi:hypothetical protein